MTWRLEYTKEAVRQLRKMGPADSKRVRDWMRKHIDGCEDPRAHGKGLTANLSVYHLGYTRTNPVCPAQAGMMRGRRCKSL